MGINIDVAVDSTSALTVDSAPGVYRSAKGSIAIKGEKNVSVRGRDAKTITDMVMVTDVDTNKTFFKKIADLKGVYTFVCDLEDAYLEVSGM